MHQSALNYAKIFFETYFPVERCSEITIAEIGSQDVNGSLREVAPKNVQYIGLDFVSGKGVDIVIEDPYKLPLPEASVDAVVSSSCFEHSEFFWLTFIEVSRILKPGGYIYINVPSNGTYHKYPVDCWRFYPDSGEALAAWGRRSGYDIQLIESFVGARSQENIWNDFVAVFQKGPLKSKSPKNSIIKQIDGYKNGRFENQSINYSEYSYEHEKVAQLELRILELQTQLAVEKENINMQILYRDELVKDLEGQIEFFSKGALGKMQLWIKKIFS